MLYEVITSGQEGVNFIDVFLAEVPQNNPTGYGVFRVATVTAVMPPNPQDRFPQPDIEPDGIGLSPVDNRSLRGVLDTAPFKWEGTNPTLKRP